MIVYVLVFFFFTGNGPILTTIDNIASAEECQRIAKELGIFSKTAVSKYTKSYGKCLAVNKVKR